MDAKSYMTMKVYRLQSPGTGDLDPDTGQFINSATPEEIDAFIYDGDAYYSDSNGQLIKANQTIITDSPLYVGDLICRAPIEETNRQGYEEVHKVTVHHDFDGTIAFYEGIL